MKELTKLYDAIHMPPELEDRIQKALPRRKPRSYPALIAAALALVLLLSPPVRAAVDGWVATTFPGLDLTIYQEDGKMVVGIATEESTFAHVEEGRLVFTGNGENLDITGLVTEEAPFFYTYSDDRGYEITLVVGYHGTIENFGTYEFIKENGEWFTGSGRNFLRMDREGEAYPWVAVVWDTLDVPWPSPGSLEIHP